MKISVINHLKIVVSAIVAVAITLLFVGRTQAQPASSTSAVATTRSSSVLGAPRWLELKPVQQLSLKPLAAIWDTLSEGHRRKWISLAQNYPKLAEPEQEKLHARMVEWASLSPKERELARLNFAQTKKLAPGERAATWDAYQALSAEEREKLAASAQRKPAGAAVAVKPVTPERLTPVPVIKKTPDTKQALVSNPGTLNRQTLLPDLLSSEAVSTNKP